MNRSIKVAVATALLLGGYSSLVARCPINILNPEITPRPLTYQGIGNISFELLEDRGLAVPAKDKYGEPTCKFNIEFSYVKLKDLDLSNVEGPLLEYFDVKYNEKQNRVYFTQKVEIPADAFKKTNIKVDVTKESTKAQKYNGFQLNVYASSVEGSQFTYTKRDESAAEVEAAEAEAAEIASSEKEVDNAEKVATGAASTAVKVAKDSSKLKSSHKEDLRKSTMKHVKSEADKVSEKVEKVNTRAINSTKEILSKKDKQVSDNSKAKDVKDSDSKKVSSTEEKSASIFGIPSLILMFISLALIGRKEER